MIKEKKTGFIYKDFLIILAMLLFTMFSSASLVMAVEPDDAQEKFLQAMDERAKGNLLEAQNILAGILINQPLLHRARLELAVTFYRLYDYDEARRQAQIVLDDQETPDTVRVTILAFMAQIDADEQAMTARKHYWDPTIALGWMYDTNVNAGPYGDIIIGGIPVQIYPGSMAQSDSAAIAIVSLNHRFQTGKTFRTGQGKGLFFWQSNASYYHRDYFNEHAFDMGVLTAGTGPAWIAIGNWRGNVIAQVDYLILGGDELAWFYSLLPSFTKQHLNGALEWTLDGTITRRDYLRQLDSDLDSVYYNLQFSMGYTFMSPRLAIQAGTRLFVEDADTDQWSNDGNGVFIASRWEFWEDGAIYGSINGLRIDYDGPAAGFVANREDRQTRYIIGVSQVLRYKWLNDLTLTGSFTRTNNNSNASTYEYDREQTMIMISRTF